MTYTGDMTFDEAVARLNRPRMKWVEGQTYVYRNGRMRVTDPRLSHGDQIPLMKIAPPKEKEEERLIIDLYEQVGLTVIQFSQPFRAAQTSGIADLLILDERRQTSWWHEVKRRQGPEYKKVSYGQTAHQKAFESAVVAAGHTYILGPLSTATSYLTGNGYIR